MGQSRIHQAELLSALVTLGSEGQGDIPIDGGRLDRALRATLGDLPEALATDLTFGVTGVGLRCYELPDILLAGLDGGTWEYGSGGHGTFRSKLRLEESQEIGFGSGMPLERLAEIGRRIVATAKDITAD